MLLSRTIETTFHSGASIHFDKAQCGAILLLSNHLATTKIWSLSVLGHRYISTKLNAAQFSYCRITQPPQSFGTGALIRFSCCRITQPPQRFGTGASIRFSCCRITQPPLRFGRFVLGLRYISTKLNAARFFYCRITCLRSLVGRLSHH